MSMCKQLSFMVCLMTCLVLAPAAGSAEPAAQEREMRLPAPFEVIPLPKKVELLEEPGIAFGEIKAIRLLTGCKRPPAGPLLSFLPCTDNEGKGVLALELSGTGTEEGYTMAISGGGVKITSPGRAGLFYGQKTLEQLMEDARDTGAVIPACVITDYPSLKYRAIHFDLKHHLDTTDYYYGLIDRLADLKINAAIFEFEDKLRYARQPEVGAPQAISIDEMAALTMYARERNIEISPLVQGLGHATFILKHEKYAHLREKRDSSWVFCPLHEETYKVLFDLYLDAMDATPKSRYLHVGGDEIEQIGICPRCKGTADEEGVFGLNLYWLNRVCEFAAKHGRIPIFWDDMPLKHAGLWGSIRHGDEKQAEAAWNKGRPVLDSMIDNFPKNCVYMRWTYDLGRNPGNIMCLDWYRDRGLKAMIATAAQNTSALLPTDDRVDVIESFIGLAAERGISGMLCTAWDDSSPHMESYWRGFTAAAEYSWSAGGRNLEAFEKAYFHRAFGPECTDAAGLYAQLYEAVTFWMGAYLAKGDRRRAGGEVIDLPDPSSPGAWSKKHEKRLERAGKEMARYEKTSAVLSGLLKKSRRNRYHLELLTAINDFQAAVPDMLLALNAFDEGKGGGKVKDALKRFDSAWAGLMKTYGKTRFLSYPASYVQDRYFHFASRTEDQTWLIQVEKELHRKIRELL